MEQDRCHDGPAKPDTRTLAHRHGPRMRGPHVHQSSFLKYQKTRARVPAGFACVLMPSMVEPVTPVPPLPMTNRTVFEASIWTTPDTGEGGRPPPLNTEYISLRL